MIQQLSGTGSNPEILLVTEEQPKLSWDINKEDPMTIDVMLDGKKVMGIGVHEVLGSIPRKHIEAAIAEIERTPWIKAWHGENAK